MTKKKKEFITREQKDRFNYICTHNNITMNQAALILLISPWLLQALLNGSIAITKQEKEMFIKKGFDLWN